MGYISGGKSVVRISFGHCLVLVCRILMYRRYYANHDATRTDGERPVCSDSVRRFSYGPIKPITCVSLSVAPLPVLPKIVIMQSPALTFSGTEKIVSIWF